MATQVHALIQPVDPRPAGLLLSDPRVAAKLVILMDVFQILLSSLSERSARVVIFYAQIIISVVLRRYLSGSRSGPKNLPFKGFFTNILQNRTKYAVNACHDVKRAL